MTERQFELRVGQLARSSLWNFAGHGLPLLFSIAAIPVIIAGFGIERFGALLLIWAIIGYFGLFDLGVGRSLVRAIADRIGRDEQGEIPAVLSSGLFFLLLLGLCGAAAIAAAAPHLEDGFLKLTPSLRAEFQTALFLIVAAVPVVIVMGGVTGTLEAHHRFDLINAVRIPFSALSFGGQVLAATFSPNLVTAVAVLFTVRIIELLIFLFLIRDHLSGAARDFRWRPAIFRELLSFGGWLTVSNIVGPIMVYFDRFIIGGVVSMAAVSFYATPYEVVTKLWILPAALLGVLFPTFSALLARDRNKAASLFATAFKIIYVSLLPAVVLLMGFSETILELWLGETFARNSARVMQVLAFGVFFNSVARLSATVIQSAGRPDMTAKLHLIEIVPYLLLLVWLTHRFEIEGAAIAWTIRVLVDGIALSIMAFRIAPDLRRLSLPLAPAAAIAAGSMLLAGFADSLPVQAVATMLAVLVVAFFSWSRLLDQGERRLILSIIGRLKVGMHR